VIATNASIALRADRFSTSTALTPGMPTRMLDSRCDVYGFVKTSQQIDLPVGGGSLVSGVEKAMAF